MWLPVLSSTTCLEAVPCQDRIQQSFEPKFAESEIGHLERQEHDFWKQLWCFLMCITIKELERVCRARCDSLLTTSSFSSLWLDGN